MCRSMGCALTDRAAEPRLLNTVRHIPGQVGHACDCIEKGPPNRINLDDAGKCDGAQKGAGVVSAFDGGVAKVAGQQMGGWQALADSRLNKSKVVEPHGLVGE